MASRMFRLLRADEIECRVATINDKGVTILLYKDARVDQNILDETVGPMNWQRTHTRDNANCIVSLWDKDKGIWVSKEDTGKESFTEAEKGLASDSFKRACFNWGIGRELYTAPFIWIPAADVNIKNDGGKCKTYDKFAISKIAYDEAGNIISLRIENLTKKETVFDINASVDNELISDVQLRALRQRCIDAMVDTEKVCACYKIKSLEELTQKMHSNINLHWDKVVDKCKVTAK